MANTFNIVVASQKGGVGKTTIAVNLAVALRLMGYRVLIVDMDYSNPSVGFYLGLEDANIGMRAVLGRRANVKSAIAMHATTGLHVLPGEVTFAAKQPEISRLSSVYREISKLGYDFIITDTPPGPMPLDLFSRFKSSGDGEVAGGKSNSEVEMEVLVVLTPTNASCTSAIRLTKNLYTARLNYKFVVNRERHVPYELSIREMEDACGDKMYAAFPEDETVPESISSHVPVYVWKKNAYFSQNIRDLARRYASKSGLTAMDSRIMIPEDAGIGYFLSRLFSALMFWRRRAE